MSSRFGLDDMEVLLWDPLSPMADPLRSFLDKDDEVLPLEGAESPLSSFSSSPHTSLSPPCSPPSPQRGEKAGLDPLSLPWMSSDELCLGRVGTDSGKGEIEHFIPDILYCCYTVIAVIILLLFPFRTFVR